MRHAAVDSVPCMLMRGGTSKGAYFLAEDLPEDQGPRDELLLRIMGSPDARQIDGIGGGHPLTSKVAIISRPAATGPVDYLFLQVSVEESHVSDTQNCGNLLAGVGPFALERGLVAPAGEVTPVPIRMVNTGGTARAWVPTPQGGVDYDGDTEISGVPGAAAPIVIDFEGAAEPEGSQATEESGSALVPTGSIVDTIDGVEVTCVDNGMPVVVLRAADLGVSGREGCAELEANAQLRKQLESIRLQAGTLMGLGDVSSLTVPKMSMVAPPADGGSVATRTFIPHRCHTSIGVLGAAGVAVACAIPGTPAHELSIPGHPETLHRVEHPTGFLDVEIELASGNDSAALPRVRRTGAVRTARKLFDGTVFARPAR